MHITIQSRNFTMTDALHSHIKRRLESALGAIDFHIHRVQVRLSEINGSRGGGDKRCHIQVILTHYPDVVIKDAEADMYIAITRAAAHAGQTTKLRLAQFRTEGRKPEIFGMPSYDDQSKPLN